MCYKKCVLQAISVTKDHTLEKAVYYKNRAAAHLKQQEFEKAIEDCTKGILLPQSTLSSRSLLKNVGYENNSQNV